MVNTRALKVTFDLEDIVTSCYKHQHDQTMYKRHESFNCESRLP